MCDLRMRALALPKPLTVAMSRLHIAEELTSTFGNDGDTTRAGLDFFARVRNMIAQGRTPTFRDWN